MFHHLVNADVLVSSACDTVNSNTVNTQTGKLQNSYGKILNFVISQYQDTFNLFYFHKNSRANIPSI